MRTASIEITRRYWLQDKLGEGGMGEVYAAFDRLTGSKVALKRVLHTPQELLFHSRFAYDGAENSAADFQRVLAHEFRVLASLRHPHIISVLDYGFDAEHYSYYTMTLIERPLTITAAARRFTVPESINAFAQMLQALAYLHRRGILHRDLKPGNVLIDERNAVKLLDFGLATQESIRGGTTGTLAYMPPEIIQQGTATPQSDLYSLGMIAYELFAGQYPFSLKDNNELLEQQLHQMPDMQPIPLKVRPIIGRLLLKNPADRYADAEAVLADLADMTGGAVAVEDANLRESFLQAARFIGREPELRRLTDRLDLIVFGVQASEAPQGAGYLIGGESGVGKSRLLDELRTHALLNGALVLRGQCLAESSQPFQMWRDVVRRLLLESDVSDLEAATLREIVPDISDLLDREVSAVPELGTVSTQNRLIETILSLFQRQTQPIVLIVEDLQWAGESFTPLRRLLALCSRLPLLIVGSYRNDEAPLLPNQLPEMVTLTLGRLTVAEIADLSHAMIGSVSEQEGLVDYLHQQSEGNVFFLVEVIRALAEDAGNLRNIGLKTLPSHVIAGGIERIIARRLERLSADAIPTLQLAALAGRNVDEALMRWLVGAEADRWLQAGMDAAILDVMDAQLRFAHDRLRDTVISLIPSAERAHFHRRIAEGLEALYPGKAELAVVLYDHWRAVGESEKEAYYAVLVMEQRMMLGILNEANLMMETALTLKPQDPDVQLRLKRRAGSIYYDMGKPKLSLEAYTETLRLARQLNRPELVGQALEGLGNASMAISNFEGALRWYEQSIDLRREIGDDNGLASSFNSLSVLYRFWGRYDDSWQALSKSVDLQRKTHEQRGLGDGLYQMSVHARNRGEYTTAISYLLEGIEVRRAIGDGRGLGDDLTNLGICYTLTGDYAQARAALLDALEVRRTTDNQRGVASCNSALGELALEQGQFAAAIGRFGNALGIWQGALDRWNIANSHACMGCVQARAGELLSAKYHLYEALEIASSIPAFFLILKALIGWAQVELSEQRQIHAAMLLGAIDVHPAMTAQLRQIYLSPVLAQLNIDLYSTEFGIGKAMDIQGLIRMILEREKPLD